MQKLEDGFGDKTIIKCSAKDCSKFTIKFKCAGLEMIIVLDKRLIQRIKTVISAVRKYPKVMLNGRHLVSNYSIFKVLLEKVVKLLTHIVP